MLGHLAVALGSIKIASALAQIHIKSLAITMALFPSRYPAAQTVVQGEVLQAMSQDMAHRRGAKLVGQ